MEAPPSATSPQIFKAANIKNMYSSSQARTGQARPGQAGMIARTIMLGAVDIKKKKNVGARSALILSRTRLGSRKKKKRMNTRGNGTSLLQLSHFLALSTPDHSSHRRTLIIIIVFTTIYTPSFLPKKGPT